MVRWMKLNSDIYLELYLRESHCLASIANCVEGLVLHRSHLSRTKHRLTSGQQSYKSIIRPITFGVHTREIGPLYSQHELDATDAPSWKIP